jgi:hypothetical protein
MNSNVPPFKALKHLTEFQDKWYKNFEGVTQCSIFLYPAKITTRLIYGTVREKRRLPYITKMTYHKRYLREN